VELMASSFGTVGVITVASIREDGILVPDFEK
jgi:hypothetical protein